ncbi:MAG: acyl-ACP thioesterase domain-containing protein [Clostridia bacterium]
MVREMDKEHTEMMQEIQEENRKLQVSGYEWDITLTEQDVEEHGWIRGDSLLHAFETIASAHVDSLDMGFEQMIAQNRIWVMTKIKYVVYKRVDPGESYHLGTYPRPKKGILFYRDYYLWDKNGDVVAAATSQWCILNFKTRRPERTDIEVPGECIDHEPFDAGIEKIRWMPEEGDDPQMLYHVTEDDLDKNQHVNNARYAVMIDETLGTSAHREVTIHFAKETVLGDEILLYTDAEKADPKAADYADGGTSQHVVGELSDSTVVFKSLVKPL